MDLLDMGFTCHHDCYFNYGRWRVREAEMFQDRLSNNSVFEGEITLFFKSMTFEFQGTAVFIDGADSRIVKAG